MSRIIATLLVLALSGPAVAADSVVIGQGISNSFLSEIKCPAGSLCMDAQYLWVLTATRTVVGPPIHGNVRAISMQHTDATRQFVRSVELFVLHPIERTASPSSSPASFSIIALSPRDPAGRYCLPMDPSTVGLRLDPSKVHAEDGHYCFDAGLL